MTTPSPSRAMPRVVIFGLNRGTTPQQLHSLLGRCEQASVRLLVPPGNLEDAIGIVELPESMAQAMAQRIRQCHVKGRRLRSWVTTMAWS